jgi:uncharacterized repeat protein (TIGR01451 family)
MAHRTKFSHLLTELLPLLLCVLAVGGLLLGAQPASAQDSGPTITGDVCMQTLFGSPVTSSNRLNCTAEDIKIAEATEVSPLSCIQGELFDLTATFEVNVTANERYDVGFYFNILGGANARLGTCSLSVLTKTLQPAEDLDGDFCGDLPSAGSVFVTFSIPDVLCNDSDGDGLVNLPNCTSWHNNRGTACNQATDAIPETKAKCKCDDAFNIPVTVEPPDISVVKTPNPTSVNFPGGNVTFTVTVTNEGDPGSGNVTLSQLVEDPDSNPATNNSITFNAANICLDTVLSPGESTTCTFTHPVTSSLTSTGRCGRVTDLVTVTGTDDQGNILVRSDTAFVDVVGCTQ